MLSGYRVADSIIDSHSPPLILPANDYANAKRGRTSQRLTGLRSRARTVKVAVRRGYAAQTSTLTSPPTFFHPDNDTRTESDPALQVRWATPRYSRTSQAPSEDGSEKTSGWDLLIDSNDSAPCVDPRNTNRPHRSSVEMPNVVRKSWSILVARGPIREKGVIRCHYWLEGRTDGPYARRECKDIYRARLRTPSKTSWEGWERRGGGSVV